MRPLGFTSPPLISFSDPLAGQEWASWLDPSPHRVQFVTVDENVKLEVLDWGSSRPNCLLSRATDWKQR
jgi:hypothetical protein